MLDGRERAWTPAIDVGRDDGHLVVRAELSVVRHTAAAVLDGWTTATHDRC
jgi:hypothetical protein